MRLVVTMMCVGLAGCAGSQFHARMMEQEGVVSVMPANSPDADFTVSIRNQQDFGFHPDIKENRDRIALDYLRSQCPAGRVVGESMVNTGQFLTGAPARTYFVRVKC